MSLRNLTFDVDFRGDAGAVTQMDSAVDELRNNALGAESAIDGMEEATTDLGRTTGSVHKMMDEAWRRTADAAQRATSAISRNWNNVSQGMANAGKTLSSTGKNLMTKVTLPIVGLGSAAIYSGAKFNDSMSKVQAISGATGEDLDQLREIAKELGRTTAHSASAAAEAMSFLALAGWDTAQILEATPHMLSLASAGAMDLAQAADIVSDTMSAFQMDASEAGAAADMFAAASSGSNTDIGQLSEAMRQAGASADAAGMDLAQTSAVLGVLADSGIKGGRAGTTLTAMLRDMRGAAEDGVLSIGDMAIEIYDAEGNMRDLGLIMAGVEQATQGMNTQQRDAALGAIFMEQSIRGANVMLATGSERYFALEGAITNSEGAAASMAETMEDNMGGAMRGLKSATEGLLITFGETMEPTVRSLTESLTKLTLWFSNLDESQRKTIITILAVIAAIGPIVWVIGKVLIVVSKLMLFLTKLWGVVSWVFGWIMVAVKVLAAIFSVSVGWIIAIIVALIAIGFLLWKYWDQIMGALGVAWGWFTSIVSDGWDFIKSLFWGGIEFIKSLNLLQAGKDLINGLITGVTERAKAAVDAVKNVASGMADTVKGFFGINSPSKLFMEYGVNLTEGLNVGMESEPLSYSERPVANTNTSSTSFSPNVNINITGGGNPRDTANEVRKEIEEWMDQYERKLELRNPAITVG